MAESIDQNPLKRILTHYIQDTPRHGLLFIEAPTGSGKSYIVNEIIKEMPETKFILVAPRRSILKTAYDNLTIGESALPEQEVLWIRSNYEHYKAFVDKWQKISSRGAKENKEMAQVRKNDYMSKDLYDSDKFHALIDRIEKIADQKERAKKSLNDEDESDNLMEMQISSDIQAFNRLIRESLLMRLHSILEQPDGPLKDDLEKAIGKSSDSDKENRRGEKIKLRIPDVRRIFSDNELTRTLLQRKEFMGFRFLRDYIPDLYADQSRVVLLTTHKEFHGISSPFHASDQLSRCPWAEQRIIFKDESDQHKTTVRDLALEQPPRYNLLTFLQSTEAFFTPGSMRQISDFSDGRHRSQYIIDPALAKRREQISQYYKRIMDHWKLWAGRIEFDPIMCEILANSDAPFIFQSTINELLGPESSKRKEQYYVYWDNASKTIFVSNISKDNTSDAKMQEKIKKRQKFIKRREKNDPSFCDPMDHWLPLYNSDSEKINDQRATEEMRKWFTEGTGIEEPDESEETEADPKKLDNNIRQMIREIRHLVDQMIEWCREVADDKERKCKHANQYEAKESVTQDVAGNRTAPGENNPLIRKILANMYPPKPAKTVSTYKSDSFYNRGYSFQYVNERASSSANLEIFNDAVLATPERLLGDLAENNLVILISATATFDSFIDNFSLSYLKDRFGENCRFLTDDEQQQLRDYEHRHHQLTNPFGSDRSVKVSVKLTNFQLNDNADENSDSRDLQNFFFFEAFGLTPEYCKAHSVNRHTALKAVSDLLDSLSSDPLLHCPPLKHKLIAIRDREGYIIGLNASGMAYYIKKYREEKLQDYELSRRLNLLIAFALLVTQVEEKTPGADSALAICNRIIRKGSEQNSMMQQMEDVCRMFGADPHSYKLYVFQGNEVMLANTKREIDNDILNHNIHPFACMAYSSTGRGFNADHITRFQKKDLILVRDNREEPEDGKLFKDFDTLYLEAPTNILPNVKAQSSSKIFDQIMSDLELLLYQVGESIECNVLDNRAAYLKPNDMYDAMRKTWAYNEAVISRLIQAAGRIQRNVFKGSQVTYCMDANTAALLSCIDPMKHNIGTESEMLVDAIREKLTTIEPQNRSIQQKKLEKYHTDRNIHIMFREAHDDLLQSLMEHPTEKEARIWHFARIYVTYHPSITKKQYAELEKIENEAGFLGVITSCYMPIPKECKGKQNKYWYEICGHVRDYCKCENILIYWDQESAGKGCMEMSDETVSLASFRKAVNPSRGIDTAAFMRTKGYDEVFWNPDADYIIHPAAVQTYLDGVIAEEAGAYYMETLFGMKALPMPTDTTEKFDGILVAQDGAEWYVDYKNWRFDFTKASKMQKITVDKMKTVHTNKAVYFNPVLRRKAVTPDSQVRFWPQEDGKQIVTINGLFFTDEHGQVCYNYDLEKSMKEVFMPKE